MRDHARIGHVRNSHLIRLPELARRRRAIGAQIGLVAARRFIALTAAAHAIVQCYEFAGDCRRQVEDAYASQQRPHIAESARPSIRFDYTASH